MDLKETDARNDCAGEAQQQFTKTEMNRTVGCHWLAAGDQHKSPANEDRRRWAWKSEKESPLLEAATKQQTAKK
jgi:hypothetical protein